MSDAQPKQDAASAEIETLKESLRAAQRCIDRLEARVEELEGQLDEVCADLAKATGHEFIGYT
jgi:peptidoglycan hydrolase CwlO-like protein